MSEKAKNAEQAEQTTPAEKEPMKTLANCTPVEFLRQTNKIRHAVADLFGAAGIAEIRKRMPALTGNESDDEKKQLKAEQSKKNMDAILDALLDVNAEATAALLAMMCFRSPKEAKSDTGMQYIRAGLEMISSVEVRNFLLMLVQLGLKNTAG